MIDSFHFIRPWFLLLLIPSALLLWMLWQRQDSTRAWRKIMDPHLLDALLTGQSQQKKLRPLTLLAAIWIIGAFALAGPTWSLEPSPFAEDQAALIIVLKVTESMEEQDVQPSRAQRAVQKIHDLLELRSGSRSALIAYSGSAHRVMPLTKDADIINSFATDLSPKIMPSEGDAAIQALTLARAQLIEANASGSILFIGDSLPTTLDFTAQNKSASSVPVQMLGIIGTDGQASLQASSQKAGGSFTAVSIDDSDVKRAARLAQSSFSPKADDKQDKEHWQDQGWWFTLLIAGFGLCWFRPGWVIAWN